MRRSGSDWDLLPAAEQPNWRNHPHYERTQERLSAAAPLVTEPELTEVRGALAAVAEGSARVLQAGDCAESFGDATLSRTAAKVTVLNELGDLLAKKVSRPVVRFGRMAGQYAKPRSNAFEVVNGVEVPVFRGHLVNSFEPDHAGRQHDPRRMLWAYQASADVLGALRTHWESGRSGPWTSHEALVLDYERPLVRAGIDGDYLGSTHFPWVGERTRQLDHAHVRLLASVTNPVGCKVGPSTDPETAVRLCELLDPGRTPGRLTLIVRMGRAIETALPPVVRAVRRAGHPVVWLSDPMHGNTVRAETGQKTRYLADIINEATAFARILDAAGAHPGGLHLEVAAEDVTECVGGPVAGERQLTTRYESLCDPRLNPEQAFELIDTVF
ncbi:3-deoxy-7-phosphoheptulonate synthase [Amycolatopsis albispora]|uniref:Phospho-2-dehydro-3-deoxyheptonate aldolase n=1 Tax=Amycolatopsis albispora TaxID=1804986 RepID=A0A344LM43_9PSEU|nr:3-deoxy-7-phosphoheptulonate synthase [Amycolatopsis albispora]AXB49117.1 phospho-2-dehydro-3-deoxyheptonate aldolase [Amycolatopsis albispora]